MPVIGAMGALIGLFFVMFFVISVAVYVYMALTLMTIARKLKYDKPWLAWIPIANLFLLPILAKKHWAMGFLGLIPIVNIVFFIMWTWIIFERRHYPGALALIPLASIIPIIGWFASIGNLVVWGLVAWNDIKK